MDFPATLPSPTRSGYSYSPAPRVQRARFDSGGLRPRRHSAASPWVVGVVWQFTQAQLAIFEAWFANDIGHGADEFGIRLANGLGMTDVIAAFTTTPKTTLRRPMMWEVSGSLRVTDFPVMSPAYLEAASAYNPNDIAYSADVLHTLIHTTLPASYW